MADQKTYLVNYKGDKPVQFRIPPSDQPMTFTLAPHSDWAVLTVEPGTKPGVTLPSAAGASASVATNAPLKPPTKSPPLKAKKDVFSKENISAVLGVLREELDRRDKIDSR